MTGIVLRGRRLFGAFLLRAWLVGAGAHAADEPDTVVLIRPGPEASAALQGAFNRLQGELRLHGFSMRVIDSPGATSPTELERHADRRRAAAAVAFLEQDDTARVDIWISDRVTGKTTKRTIQPGPGQDAATMLAVRALELLRASLRESSELAEAPVELPDVHPERAARAVQALARTPIERPWVVGAQGFAAWSLPTGGASAGPELTAGYGLNGWGLRALWRGPAWGAGHSTAAGSFDVRWLGLAVEAPIDVLTGHAELRVFPSVGAARWDVHGEAFAPFRGRVDAAWTATLGGGVELAFALDGEERVHVVTAWRAVTSLPTPRVHLAGERWTLSAPLLSTSAGLQFTF